MQSTRLQAVLQGLKNALLEYGVLLDSDSKFPNLVGIVAGEPVRGSWWGHPMGHLINEAGRALGSDPDVLEARLLSKKVTYIHRELWSPFIAIATSEEPWQLKGLRGSARLLFNELKSRGELRTDELSHPKQPSGKLLGESARELERRLLVYGRGFHTARGYHAKHLQTWDLWMKKAGFVPQSIQTSEAKEIFETRIDPLNDKFGAQARLPWRKTFSKPKA